MQRKSISNVGPNVHANPHETDLFENLCSSDYRFIFHWPSFLYAPTGAGRIDDDNDDDDDDDDEDDDFSSNTNRNDRWLLRF